VLIVPDAITAYPCGLQQKQPHDAKLADPFYDALEDLLHDLRTVTMVRLVVPNYPTRLFHLVRLSRITMMLTPSSNLYPGRMSRITMTVRFYLFDAITNHPNPHRALDITNPMDFQTMLKKVKQKQYKSKKEFKDDLDLIWSNCFQYNAADVRRLSSHPFPLQ
jgi:transcriptional activator SPT7